jgi:hypothetical protein
MVSKGIRATAFFQLTNKEDIKHNPENIRPFPPISLSCFVFRSFVRRRLASPAAALRLRFFFLPPPPPTPAHCYSSISSPVFCFCFCFHFHFHFRFNSNFDSDFVHTQLDVTISNRLQSLTLRFTLLELIHHLDSRDHLEVSLDKQPDGDNDPETVEEGEVDPSTLC